MLFIDQLYSIQRLNLGEICTNIDQVLSSKLLFHEFREMYRKGQTQTHTMGFFPVTTLFCSMSFLKNFESFFSRQCRHRNFPPSFVAELYVWQECLSISTGPESPPVRRGATYPVLYIAPGPS